MPGCIYIGKAEECRLLSDIVEKHGRYFIIFRYSGFFLVSLDNCYVRHADCSSGISTEESGPERGITSRQLITLEKDLQ